MDPLSPTRTSGRDGGRARGGCDRSWEGQEGGWVESGQGTSESPGRPKGRTPTDWVSTGLIYSRWRGGSPSPSLFSVSDQMFPSLRSGPTEEEGFLFLKSMTGTPLDLGSGVPVPDPPTSPVWTLGHYQGTRVAVDGTRLGTRTEMSGLGGGTRRMGRGWG